MALAHVAVGGDAAGGSEGRAFGKFSTDLRDISGSFVGAAKRVGACGPERFQFFASLRYEAVFVFHLRAATLRVFAQRSRRITTAICARGPFVLVRRSRPR